MSLFVAASLLAMGPQWVIVDLPYPDVAESQSSGAPSAHAEALEAALAYARTRTPGVRKADVTKLKVEGGKAFATINFGDRVEPVQLVQLNGEWRVLPAER